VTEVVDSEGRAARWCGMRILQLATLLIASLLPVVAAARTQVGPIAVVSGAAAFASFESTSADGCERTEGEVFVVEAHTEFHLANGLYVSAFRHNSCTGEMNGYGGYAEGAFNVLGLVFAHFGGVVVADAFSDAAPITLELDLWWIGTGEATRENGVYEDGPAIHFSFKGERPARTVGSFTVDGEAASVTSARLVRETTGEIALPQP
jgi:hypothetical protein